MDHVFIGYYNDEIHPDKKEVKDYCYKTFEEIETSLQTHPHKYTAWFKIAFPKVAEWMKR